MKFVTAHRILKHSTPKIHNAATVTNFTKRLFQLSTYMYAQCNSRSLDLFYQKRLIYYIDVQISI